MGQAHRGVSKRDGLLVPPGEQGFVANRPCGLVVLANWGQDKVRGTNTTRLNGFVSHLKG